MCEYISINELDTFEFHDAVFTSAELTDTDMIWTLKAVNVTTKNTQNNHNDDMQADSTKITFFNYEITRLELYGSSIYDSAGNLIKQYPSVTVPASEYHQYILNITKEPYSWIHESSTIEEKSLCYSFCIESAKVFTIDINYS